MGILWSVYSKWMGKSTLQMCKQLVKKVNRLIEHYYQDFINALELELANADQAFAGAGHDGFIEKPSLTADALTLESALQSSYASHVLQGETL